VQARSSDAAAGQEFRKPAGGRTVASRRDLGLGARARGRRRGTRRCNCRSGHGGL